MDEEPSKTRSNIDPCVAVIGLGYVGLPLAVASARAGNRTIGVDADRERAETLALGHSHVDDISSSALQRALSENLEIATDFGEISAADVVVICVPTPLGTSGNPDLRHVVSATEQITPHLKSGALVVLESTSYPGTTEEIVMPIIEGSNRRLDEHFFLAFSPERIDPGNSHFDLANTPRIIGGASEQSAQKAVNFYKRMVTNVTVLSGTREAEMAKLIENTYRHVNIAMVNELAIVCHELGINVWEAIQGASTKPFGYQKFTPGAGVGGHCIPIDPMYLDNMVKTKLGRGLEFINLAQTINQGMPRYVGSRVVEMLAGKEREHRRVLLMGVSYKADVADTRETPARELAQFLIAEGFDVSFHDPYVREFFLEDGTEIAHEPDWVNTIARHAAAVILQPHREYVENIVQPLGSNVLDCTGRFSEYVSDVL